MPRNSNGDYSLPAGNPVTTGTVISSTWANTTLSDIATAMTGSLARNGDGGMTGQFKADAGTIGAPGITWSAETTSGWYRASAGNFRFAIGGADIITITAAGISGSVSASSLAVSGNATIGGTLGVTGLVTLGGGITVSAGAVTLPAASIADAALSSNVPLKNAANTFTAVQTINLGSGYLRVTDGTRTADFGIDSTSGYLATATAHPFDFYTSNLKRGSISAVGNWTINAPSSGNSLNVAGVAGGVATAITQAAGDYAMTVTDGTSTFGLYNVSQTRLGTNSNHGLAFYTNGAGNDRLTISAAGNVTITAPASGDTLVLNTFSGASSFTASDGTVNSFWAPYAVSGLQVGTFSNHGFEVWANSLKVATFHVGQVIGSPTGGDKGAGTLNTAGAIYQNNVAVGLGDVSSTTALNGSAIAVGQTYRVVKTSATARNNTIAVSADPDLQITNLPLGRYIVRAKIQFSAGAGGCRWQINNGSCDGFAVDGSGAVSSQQGASPLTDAGGGEWQIFSEGTLISGTLSIDWAQNVSDAANTALDGSNADSYLEVVRIN